MEHVDALGESSHVQDAVFQAGMNADLTDAGTNPGHRLPIVRSQALLYASQLKAGRPARIARESG
jgi:hypothetical protein